MSNILDMYAPCPHCGTLGRDIILLNKQQAEQILRKEIPYDHILLCPKGCRYTVVDRWNLGINNAI